MNLSQYLSKQLFQDTPTIYISKTRFPFVKKFILNKETKNLKKTHSDILI